MHQQIRTDPVASPPDLDRFLEPLVTAGVNIVAAGGGFLELGGEFAIAVHDEHGDDATERAVGLLEAAGYEPRVVTYDAQALDQGEYEGLYVCWMDDKPGELQRCLREASEVNARRLQDSGWVIKDIAIGVPVDGRVPVQVYSVQVKA